MVLESLILTIICLGSLLTVFPTHSVPKILEGLGDSECACRTPGDSECAVRVGCIDPNMK